ncbi:hypothetical protein BDR26DRAFT_851148 [Obelidium mucronatum]|nr:hypothetical protein BDR26DRAFT_851148 [Obelidium mucronatum]
MRGHLFLLALSLLWNTVVARRFPSCRNSNATLLVSHGGPSLRGIWIPGESSKSTDTQRSLVTGLLSPGSRESHSLHDSWIMLRSSIDSTTIDCISSTLTAEFSCGAHAIVIPFSHSQSDQLHSDIPSFFVTEADYKSLYLSVINNLNSTSSGYGSMFAKVVPDGSPHSIPSAVVMIVFFMWPLVILVIHEAIHSFPILNEYRKGLENVRRVKRLPVITWSCKRNENDWSTRCTICLEDYCEGETLRVLPCAHQFHGGCIDRWLIEIVSTCPFCKRSINVECSQRKSISTASPS